MDFRHRFVVSSALRFRNQTVHRQYISLYRFRNFEMRDDMLDLRKTGVMMTAGGIVMCMIVCMVRICMCVSMTVTVMLSSRIAMHRIVYVTGAVMRCMTVTVIIIMCVIMAVYMFVMLFESEDVLTFLSLSVNRHRDMSSGKSAFHHLLRCHRNSGKAKVIETPQKIPGIGVKFQKGCGQHIPRGAHAAFQIDSSHRPPPM